MISYEYSKEKHLILYNLLLNNGLLKQPFFQTGDKWSHLPDVTDWLLLDENIVVLVLFHAASLIALSIYVIKGRNSRAASIAQIASFVLIFLHNTAEGNLGLAIDIFNTKYALCPLSFKAIFSLSSQFQGCEGSPVGVPAVRPSIAPTVAVSKQKKHLLAMRGSVVRPATRSGLAFTPAEHAALCVLSGRGGGHVQPLEC